jgi:type II secretory pathway pseudopilin PulG
MIRVGIKSSGFTIIELLVVIASTGILLGIAFAFIGNQVNQTGFQTGTRSFQTQLQTILNQVTSGSYTFPNDVSCSGNSNPAAGSPSISTIPFSTQGSNNGCIFLGKSIYIGNDTSSPYTTNTAKFTAFSIAGNQCSTYISGPTPLCASNPSTLSGLSGAHPTYVMIPDAEDNYNVEGGLRFKYITYDNLPSPTPVNTICGFGIINSPSSAGSSFGLYKLETNTVATPPSIGCDNIPSQPSPSTYQNDDSKLTDMNIVDSIQLCMYNVANTNQTIGLNISSPIGSGQTQSNNFNISIIGTGC